mgnify:CR=1 FL=1
MFRYAPQCHAAHPAGYHTTRFVQSVSMSKLRAPFSWVRGLFVCEGNCFCGFRWVFSLNLYVVSLFRFC